MKLIYQELSAYAGSTFLKCFNVFTAKNIIFTLTDVVVLFVTRRKHSSIFRNHNEP